MRILTARNCYFLITKKKILKKINNDSGLSELLGVSTTTEAQISILYHCVFLPSLFVLFVKPMHVNDCQLENQPTSAVTGKEY